MSEAPSFAGPAALIYRKTASDSKPPIDLICSSVKPPIIAAVAPPMRKLCPENLPLKDPCAATLFTTDDTAADVSCPPLFDKNKKSGVPSGKSAVTLGLTARYSSGSLTGQHSESNGSTGTKKPCAKGSVLERRMRNHNRPSCQRKS